MEPKDQIYDPVGETEIEGRQSASAAMKFVQIHRDIVTHRDMSKTEAERYNLWFISDCSYPMENKSRIQYSALPDEIVQ